MHNSIPSKVRILSFIAGTAGLLVTGATGPACGAVVAWGWNSAGQTNVPSDLTNAVAFSAGGSHNLALRADGTVVAWGDNTYHQTNVPAGLSNVVAVSAGSTHSLALRADGTIVGWGDNLEGQATPPGDLGSAVAISAGSFFSLALKPDGRVVEWGQTYTGVKVPDDLNNVIAIANGASHRMALKADGTVVVWGDNFYGQTNVPSGLKSVVAIRGSRGGSHSLALRSDGTLVAWGLNTWGQGSVPSGLERVIGIAAGAGHNLACQADGTVLAWGVNFDGETNVPPGLSNVISVACGDFHSLALTDEGPPFVTTHLMSRTAEPGGTSVFYVEATGAKLLTYQWQFNATNVPGATDAALVLTNVQVGQAGMYRVLVQNSHGTANSSEAELKVTGAAGCVTAPPGLAGWWTADGNSTDATRGGNDGTLKPGVSYQPGKVGQAFEFHGTNEYIVVADSPTLDPINGFTAEAWIYPTLPPHVWATVLTKNREAELQYQVHVIRTTQAQAVLYGGVSTAEGNFTFQGTHAIPLNTWTHVAMTYDQTNLSFYVNGILDAAHPAKGALRVTTAPLSIGGNPYFLFDGRIDELSIYDRALSAFELRGIYSAGSAGKCAGPLPLRIVSQPQDQTVSIGGTATFAVQAKSTTPGDWLTYQWLCDGTNLPGMTNDTLILRNVQVRQAGPYSVQVSGSGGTVISAPAMLSVVGMVAWGRPDLQQTSLPRGLSNVVAIAAGYYHNMALTADGTVAVAGWGNFGETVVPSGLNYVVAIAAGFYHCLALKSDSSVVAWGQDLYGQGHVPAGLTNIATIAAGAFHNLALRGDGKVFGWGRNDYGQVSIPLDLTNVIAIAAGEDHSLGLQADGTVRAWGSNVEGQANIPPGLGPVVAIAAGGWHNLAIKADGTVAAWGSGGHGQTAVPANLSGIVAISAGEYHSLALKSDGTIVGWGTDFGGVTNIPKGLKNVVAISSAFEHCVALIGDGPPFLTAPLMNRTAAIGGTTVFRAAVTGTAPFAYQWMHNGTWLSGATNPVLVLTNLEPSQAGNYSVQVSNSRGSLTSFGESLDLVQTHSCQKPPMGLVGWWRGEGDTRDECTGSSGGMPSGQVSFGPGRVGRGFVFGGAGPGVLLYNPFELHTVDVTVETWIRRSSPTIVSLNETGSPAQIFGYDRGGYQLSLDALGRPFWSVPYMGGTGPDFKIADTNFHHLAVTKSGSNIVFYVDGNAVGSGIFDPGFTFSGQVWIGGLGTGEGFYGSVDEASVYNRALGASEVQDLFQAGSAGKCLSPLPPVLIMQPTNQTVAAGSTLYMPVFAKGTEPISFQWYFNGNSIPGGRDGILMIRNVQASNAGTYYVAVTNAAGPVYSSNAIVTVTSSSTVVQAQGGPVDSGTTISVPLQIVANGNENALAFTLGFPAAALRYLDLQPGTGATAATFMVNTNRASSGLIGLAIGLPAGTTFRPGTQELATISFSVPAVNAPIGAELSFGDYPARRQVVDTNAVVVPAIFLNSTLQIESAGYEADVAPRPNGDGEVTVADWALMGRFVAHLDFPTNFSDFRRADCAPRGGLGDGVIGLADWVQVGRYAIGLDPLTVAGGAGLVRGPRVAALQSPAAQAPAQAYGRQISIAHASAAANELTTVAITLAAEGDETALAFSVCFDPSVLSYDSTTLGRQAALAQLNVNTAEARSGRLGFALALPPGSQAFAAGAREVVKIQFRTAAAARGQFQIRLTDQPVPREVCSAGALELRASYLDGSITVDPQPKLRFSRSGQSLVLSWPLWATNAVLQQTTSASPSSAWGSVPNPATLTNNERRFTVPLSTGPMFYRLYSPAPQ